MSSKLKETFNIILEKDVVIQELEDQKEELERYFHRQKKNFIEASEYNHVTTENSALKSNLKIMNSRLEVLEKANQNLLVKALQIKAKCS
mmetsp:Transcript_23757/g.23674  ORF Transcript_23757/g.23674 Transcript_23757/m.23674 type:complete len:90 (-) Transcript_23757:173-442(-)